MPAATWNRIAEFDPLMSYAEMAAVFQQGNLGVLSEGAALALWRACADRDLRAWCYEFGFPESLTYTVTIVEIDGVLQVHDAFFNLSYPIGLREMLASLRDGNAVNGKRGVRDRKIYIMDPAREPQATVRWLEANTDRELNPVAGLRRFELLWNPEAYTATCKEIDAVSRDLATHGYPGDLQFLMLHPVSVFDGETHHRDRADMPLIGGLDLKSPVAALRVAARDLETERARGSEKVATIARIEAELAQANSRCAALVDVADRALATERQVWMQQRVAMQASRNALQGDLAKTQSQLAAAVDLRAQRDSQVAQLRAELADAATQFELQRNAVAALERKELELEADRLSLESENRDLTKQIEAAVSENSELRAQTVLLQGQIASAEEHAIEIAHCVAPILHEVDQLRRDYRSAVADREAAARDKLQIEAEIEALRSRFNEALTRVDALQAEIAASPGARTTALWSRFATRWHMMFRVGRVRNYPADSPAEKLRN